MCHFDNYTNVLHKQITQIRCFRESLRIISREKKVLASISIEETSDINKTHVLIHLKCTSNFEV